MEHTGWRQPGGCVLVPASSAVLQDGTNDASGGSNLRRGHFRRIDVNAAGVARICAHHDTGIVLQQALAQSLRVSALYRRQFDAR